MMNIPSARRSKFCSLQETKAAAVLGGVIVAGLAGGAVADGTVLGSGFRLTGEANITCQYTYRDGILDDENHCSSFFEYGYTVSGINDSTAYTAARSGWGGADFDPTMCPLSRQSFHVSASSTSHGNSGSASLTVGLYEVPPSSLVDRTTTVEMDVEGRSSLLVTSFSTWNLGYNVSITGLSGNFTHRVAGPNLSLVNTGSYHNMTLWPGVYTLFVDGNGVSESSGLFSISYWSRIGLNFQLSNQSTIAPPPCTGSNRCADTNNDGNFDLSDLYGWYASPIDVTGDDLFDAGPYSDDASWIAGMLLATDDTLNDCNENGFPDVYDIFIGSPFGGSEDANSDGIPDECQAADCPADLTGDGSLNFFDISEFLQGFESQDPIADFTNDGLFDFFDISAFLQAFAAGCP